MPISESKLFGQSPSGGDAQVRLDAGGNIRVAGTVEHDAADAQGPVKIGAQARTTNPTAVSDADRVNVIADDIGRVVNYPYQVRDLVATAQASLTTGTTQTLLAAASGVFNDLISITASNSSDQAATFDITEGNGGGVTVKFRVPANNTISLNFPAPIPASAANETWYADLEDITGTTVTVSAVFIKNV